MFVNLADYQELKKINMYRLYSHLTIKYRYTVIYIFKIFYKSV